MNRNEKVRPNVFIIGAPRSGTTAIAMYLSNHPNVFLSKMKEPQYFASDFKNRPVRYLKAYESLFTKANASVHKVIVDASTWYLFSSVAVPHILEYQSNALFVVILRDPSEMVVSLHRYLVMHGKENILSFSDAWNAQDKRALGRMLPFGCREEKMVQYAEWGKLGTQVSRLLSKVDRNRVLFLTTNELKHQPRRMWLKLLNFLALEDYGRNEFPRINESGNAALPYALRRLVGISRSTATAIMSASGITWNQWSSYSPYWRNRKERSSNRSARVKPVSDSVLKMLRSYYANEVRMLSELLNMDFNSLWGY